MIIQVKLLTKYAYYFRQNMNVKSVKLALRNHLCHLNFQQFHWVILGGHLV